METAVHRRDHRSILADAEKRLLVRIAAALPRAVHSDHLSAFALGSMLAAGVGFAVMRVSAVGAIVVVVALAGNWFGDSLDGTVARVRGHERPRFGFYVDHAIDLLGTVALFVGLACSGLIAPVLALAVLAGYLLVCAESFLGTHATGVFRMSAFGIGATELRLLLAMGAIAAARSPLVQVPTLGTVRLLDVGGSIAVVALAATFLVSFIQQTVALFRAEPRPSGRAAWEE